MIEYNRFSKERTDSPDDFEELGLHGETILKIDGLFQGTTEKYQLDKNKFDDVAMEKDGKWPVNFVAGIVPESEDQFPGEQYDGIRITTDNHVMYIYITPHRHCCELFGTILSEDDLSVFIGSKLKRVYLTNTAMVNEYIDYIFTQRSPSSEHYRIQFINFETDKGVFQLTVYNIDNGFYGQDIIIKVDEATTYKNRLGGECR